MRILRKIMFIVLALLPIIAIIYYGINMIADGNTFSNIELHNIIDYAIQELQTETSNTLITATNNLFESLNNVVPISKYVILAFAYLAYLFVVEMLLFVYDLLVFVPRKCSELFNRS